jgi:hypothetical protein
MRRRDGSIQSANLPAYNKLAKNRIDKDYGLYRCMVTKVYFTDDTSGLYSSNPTYENVQVTYEAVIIGGAKEGQILQNVKAMSDYGGQYNYSERIYRPTSTKNLEETPISEQDGDIVYVLFVQGNTRAPVIIGAGVQPLDEDFTGSTTEDGFVDQRQYNGVYQLIDKNGQYSLIRKGGSLDPDSGVFVPTQDGNLASFQLMDEQVIHSVGGNVITSTMDGAANTMTIAFKSGLTVTLNGEADSAQIKTAGGGELNIVGGKLALGAASAELFDQFSKTLGKLITFMNSVDSTHEHLGNLGYPTSAPITASQFTQLGTDLQAIQTLIDGIKGSL